MSNAAISRVLDSSKSTGTARLILLILADYANEDGTAWPSTTTLAAKANTSKRNVLKTLTKLEEAGEVTRCGQGMRGVVKYHITVVTGELQDTSEPQDTSELGYTSTGEPQYTGSGEPQYTQTLIKPLVTPQDNISDDTKRARKLSVDWEPSEKDRQYALDRNWTDSEIREEVENFIEHFTNGNGRKQTSPDWSKRWQRWVRTNYGGRGANETAKRRAGLAEGYRRMEVHGQRGATSNPARPSAFEGVSLEGPGARKQGGGYGSA